MRTTRRTAAALLVGVGAACLLAAAPPVFAQDADMAARIEAAKTPADHEALAAEFDKLAAQETAKAKLHEKMKAGYIAMGGKPKNEAGSHCETLARDATSAAKSYKALADVERGLAKGAN